MHECAIYMEGRRTKFDILEKKEQSQEELPKYDLQHVTKTNKMLFKQILYSFQYFGNQNIREYNSF